MANSNPRVIPIAINGSAGPLTDIVLTIMASKVRVQEDPSYNNGALQGLTGFFTDTQPASGYPNVGPQKVWLQNDNGQEGPAYQPIDFGGGEGGRVHGGFGEYVGAQGTIILRLKMNGPNAGGILLEQWA
jgi:hypothetical protein